MRSFGFAFAGLRYLVASEHNAWLHLAAALLVVIGGALLDLGHEGWLWIVLAIGWVWTAEAFNAAIERLADRVSAEHDPQIGVVKDLAAAGVLTSAIGAGVIGVLVLGPKTFLLFS
jgi:diacylglycerol kinase (ATP)